MTNEPVNWRDLKTGDRVKVMFEATVHSQSSATLYLGLAPTYVIGFRAGAEINAATITQIEEPWKVGDRTHAGKILLIADGWAWVDAPNDRPHTHAVQDLRRPS